MQVGGQSCAAAAMTRSSFCHVEEVTRAALLAARETDLAAMMRLARGSCAALQNVITLKALLRDSESRRREAIAEEESIVRGMYLVGVCGLQRDAVASRDGARALWCSEEATRRSFEACGGVL